MSSIQPTQNKLKPFSGSMGEAIMKLQEYDRQLFYGDIDQPTYKKLAQPYIDRINDRITRIRQK